MAMNINVGQLRTRIIIKSIVTGLDADGYTIKQWTPLWGEGVSVGCRWVNAHGREVFEAERLNLRELATLTMRYTPLVNVRCRIWRSGETEDDAHAYEIISVDDIQDRHEMLELKVQRVVKA